MANRLYICSITCEYIDYIRTFDSSVRIDSNGNKKYVGVLLEINNHNYYAPLSSPKDKFNKISDKALDIYKIDDGKLGVINLNNMIPVPKSEVIRINIDDQEDSRYRSLLRKQARIIMANRDEIKDKSLKLYSVVSSGNHPHINKRCSNFYLLEEKCSEYQNIFAVSETIISEAE